MQAPLQTILAQLESEVGLGQRYGLVQSFGLGLGLGLGQRYERADSQHSPQSDAPK